MLTVKFVYHNHASAPTPDAYWLGVCRALDVHAGDNVLGGTEVRLIDLDGSPFPEGRFEYIGDKHPFSVAYVMNEHGKTVQVIR